MKKLKAVCLVLVVASTIMSCSGGGDDPVTPPVTPPTGGVTNPTYTANIKAIIDGNCITCHGPGGEQSSHPLLTYEQVSARASDIMERIAKPAGDPMVMPKGGKLSQVNIDLINKWITNGMPN
jgi:mono/diheme cytochrome c family protein